MKITWFGNAALVLETAGERILFDPMVELQGGDNPNSLDDFLQEETIFITHGHFDHLYYVSRILEEGDATVFCTACPAATLEKYTEDTQNVVQIRMGDEIAIGDVSIKALQGRHIDFDKRLFQFILNPKRLLKYWRNLPFLFWANKAFPEGEETVVFRIRAEGKTILLLGSLGLDEHTEYPEQVDLLILPYQGSCELEKEAVALIDQIKPKKIFLTHFDNSIPPLSRTIDTRPFKKMMDEKYPRVQVVKPKAGKTVEF